MSESPDQPAAPARSRRGVPPALAAVVALLVGAGGAAGGLYLAGWREVPEQSYNVMVILKQEATPEQKAAVKAVLEKLPTPTGLHLATRAEAYAEAKQAYAGVDSDAVDALTEESMPESYRVTTSSRDFDCAPLKPLTSLQGISKLSIVRPNTADSPGAQIIC
ncbi:permease-like cell division protein FtsX [Actinoplanes awajinensis]|uniref:permease-like cell division protein FtsX n=1 Tax=Actinoplanes awajinensis TaxID=135946 RepID=UPI000AE74B6A|nr:permease-like cell division protein FtsX [Actinoplanes awajinensis]